MNIVKKNIFSILCGVVALVGVIAWFFPIGGMYAGLESRVKARAQVYEQAEALKKAPRNLPIIELVGGEQEPLGRFPNDKVILVGKNATKAMTAQSTKMLKTVSDMNIHAPLVPGSLPKAAGRIRFDFIDDYRTKLGWGEAGWEEGLPATLKATTPPTDEEIAAKAEELWETKFAKQVVEIGGQNNLANIGAQFLAEAKGLPEKEREGRARAHMVYLSDGALPVSPAIEPGGSPPDPEIWYAQTALWIEEDVVQSIVAANADARDVRDAPVKHLVALGVPFGPEQYIMAGAPGSAGPASSEEGTAAVPADANGAPAVWSVSPTGRVCNELYDVIHFDLVLRTDARKVPQVLTELERNQLVTVLKTDVAAVDAAAERKQFGYVYGNDPVVELTLQCEALFLRSWTIGGKTPLMPIEVQQAIGAQPPAAEAASAE